MFNFNVILRRSFASVLPSKLFELKDNTQQPKRNIQRPWGPKLFTFKVNNNIALRPDERERVEKAEIINFWWHSKALTGRGGHGRRSEAKTFLGTEKTQPSNHENIRFFGRHKKAFGEYETTSEKQKICRPWDPKKFSHFTFKSLLSDEKLS